MNESSLPTLRKHYANQDMNHLVNLDYGASAYTFRALGVDKASKSFFLGKKNAGFVRKRLNGSD